MAWKKPAGEHCSFTSVRAPGGAAGPTAEHCSFTSVRNGEKSVPKIVFGGLQPNRLAHVSVRNGPLARSSSVARGRRLPRTLPDWSAASRRSPDLAPLRGQTGQTGRREEGGSGRRGEGDLEGNGQGKEEGRSNTRITTAFEPRREPARQLLASAFPDEVG